MKDRYVFALLTRVNYFQDHITNYRSRVENSQTNVLKKTLTTKTYKKSYIDLSIFYGHYNRLHFSVKNGIITPVQPTIVLKRYNYKHSNEKRKLTYANINFHYIFSRTKNFYFYGHHNRFNFSVKNGIVTPVLPTIVLKRVNYKHLNEKRKLAYANINFHYIFSHTKNLDKNVSNLFLKRQTTLIK